MRDAVKGFCVLVVLGSMLEAVFEGSRYQSLIRLVIAGRIVLALIAAAAGII